MISLVRSRFVAAVIAAACALGGPAAGGAAAKKPFVEPQFLLPSNPDVSDYRPVVDAAATTVIFERTFHDNPSVTTLYGLNLATREVRPVVTFQSFRPDWCWLRSAQGISDGPLAFSNSDGVYLLKFDGSPPALLPETAGMIYPSWYPNCRHVAADDTTNQVTVKIDAATGRTVRSPLANDAVFAGFPSVDQAHPNLIGFAGQTRAGSHYYNQDLNYPWVTDTSTEPARVMPLDQRVPDRPGFLPKFQARAGWWSPDGKWFAFESNRICNDVDGLTYAIFIQDAAGARPAMQVTDCKLNLNHPKWFPPSYNGGRATLIAAAAEPGSNKPFAIVTLDVADFVTGH
jgi:hypothetical protein